MTRFLADLLAAEQPTFGLRVRQLERANGLPSQDIRLTTEILARSRDKVRELGLDPHDTTAEELYHSLEQRISKDEVTLAGVLKLDAAASPQQIITAVQKLLKKTKQPRQCYALKASAAKRLLKTKPPRAAMRHLGYRSIDSMLKHESVADLYAAASLTEDRAWWDAFHEAYRSLKPSDFEPRLMQISAPKTKRWQKLSDTMASGLRHNVLCFAELGSVVMLPMPADTRLRGLSLALVLLVQHGLNDVRVASSRLKMMQLKHDFGKRLEAMMVEVPTTLVATADSLLPWRVVHRFFALRGEYVAALFEPHVQPEDLSWQEDGEVLSELDPALRFWQGSSLCGFVAAGQTVSLHALDAVLNFCNRLPFTARTSDYLREDVWQELTGRYLQPVAVEAQIADEYGDASLQLA